MHDDDDARPRRTRSTRTTTENPRRLIVAEREARRRVEVAAADVLAVPGDAVHVHRRSRTSTASRTAASADNPLFLINHWLRPDGPPDPPRPAKVNSKKVLSEPASGSARAAQAACRTSSRWTSPRSATSTERSNRFNGAVRDRDRRPGVGGPGAPAPRDSGKLTPAQLAELRGIRRLPKVSEARRASCSARSPTSWCRRRRSWTSSGRTGSSPTFAAHDDDHDRSRFRTGAVGRSPLRCAH